MGSVRRGHGYTQPVGRNQVRPIDPSRLESLYRWVDEIPFSRPKKHLNRDFSDGVMVAELVHYFLPKLVDVRCYSGGSSSRVKEHNWFHLNKTTLRPLGLDVSPDVIREITQCKQWAIENVLLVIRDKLDDHLAVDRLRNSWTDIHEVQDLEVQSWQQTKQYDQYNVQDQSQVMEGSQTMRRLQDRQNLREKQHLPRVHQAESPQSKSVTPRGGGVTAMQPTQPRLSMSTTPSKGSQSVVTESAYHPLLPSPRSSTGEEVVPRKLLNKKEDKLKSQTKLIQSLKTKVEQLEYLLQLKDIRIDDLCSRLEEMEALGAMNKQPIIDTSRLHNSPRPPAKRRGTTWRV